ncbi:twin-arginine translocase TatA/TatE family subunit [Streptomyces yangpuensis]|uniref:twin-arginine translocase TatA/TatE family subunit n=1 Tax=Streptomyces yangpuensis TaxID=1648182 RepID=UPI00371D3D0F
MFGISEMAIVLILLVLLLGARKLPELARAVGKSARMLKREVRAADDEPAAGSKRVIEVTPADVIDPRPDSGASRS